MYSENFMRYLISYQSDEIQEEKPVQKKVASKKYSMIDLIGVKYAPVPIKHSAK